MDIVQEEEEDDDDDEKSKLKRENIVLQCLLKDLVVGSGLDWYNDPRLRRILTSPSNDE